MRGTLSRPVSDSIFFLELGGGGGSGGAGGAGRDEIAMCALESAAFYNPGSPVFLLTEHGYKFASGLFQKKITL